MNEPVKLTVHQGFSSRARLGTMGLSTERLLEVIIDGERARAQETGFDPAGAGGYDARRYRIRSLREAWTPDGWHAHRRRGLEMLASPGYDFCILTRAGTHDVGLTHPGANPQPKSEVGSSTSMAMEGSLALFDAKWFAERGPAEQPEYEIWLLLVYYSPDSIRSELSLGSGCVDEKVARWIERIILPEIDPRDLNYKKYGGDEDSEVEFDVPVVRKPA